MRNESFTPKQIDRIVENRVTVISLVGLFGFTILSTYIYNVYRSFGEDLIIFGSIPAIGVLAWIQIKLPTILLLQIGRAECRSFGHYWHPDWKQEKIDSEKSACCHRCWENVSAEEWQRVKKE